LKILFMKNILCYYVDNLFMNIYTMLDKKMTPPEQQQGNNSNPSNPSMPSQSTGIPQDDLTGDSTVSATNQQGQLQDDQTTGDDQTDDTNVLGAYPPVPPQVTPQDEEKQDTEDSTAGVSQPTVVDTQHIDVKEPTEDESQDKQSVGENIQPEDKSPLPVGENAPLQDTSSGVDEGANVDESVKDMAKPVEPPLMEESQDTMGRDEEAQTQAVSGNDSSQVPQGTSSEQQPNAPVNMQSQTSSSNEGQSPAGPVAPSQTNSDQLSQSFQIPPASHTVGPTDQGQAQPIPPSQGGDTVPVAPLSQAQDDNSEEQTLKKAHEPVFILPDDYHNAMTIPIRVRVSSVPHPMDEDHYIQSIELFANGTSVGKVELQPKENEMAEAEFQVNIQKGMVLRAVATCNRHGDWASEKTV
jgi:desulfoferrodoxin-like iron-binding protein